MLGTTLQRERKKYSFCDVEQGGEAGGGAGIVGGVQGGGHHARLKPMSRALSPFLTHHRC